MALLLPIISLRTVSPLSLKVHPNPRREDFIRRWDLDESVANLVRALSLPQLNEAGRGFPAFSGVGFKMV